MSFDDLAVKKPRRKKRLKEKVIEGTVQRLGRVPPIAVGYVWSEKDQHWLLLGFHRYGGNFRPKAVQSLRRKFAIPDSALFRVMDLFVAKAVGPGDPPKQERANRDSPLENLPAPKTEPPAEARRVDQAGVPVTKQTAFIAIRVALHGAKTLKSGKVVPPVLDEHPLYLGPLLADDAVAALIEAREQFPLGVVSIRWMGQLTKSMRRRICNGAIQPGMRLKFPKEEAQDDDADLPGLQDGDSRSDGPGDGRVREAPGAGVPEAQDDTLTGGDDK